MGYPYPDLANALPGLTRGSGLGVFGFEQGLLSLLFKVLGWV